MKTIKVTKHVHMYSWDYEKTVTGQYHDDYNPDLVFMDVAREDDQTYVYLCPVEISVHIDTGHEGMTKLVDTLERSAVRQRADHQIAEQRLADRIQNLLALPATLEQ